jgi:transposase
MPKSHAPYCAEFRAEAMRLVRTSGKTKTAIAQELGVSLEALRDWLRQAELDAGERHDGLTTEELAELRRLRKEVRVRREERESVVKAAAFFGSPSLGRPTCSREEIRVRRAVEGLLCDPAAVPRPRCLPERLLGVAAARDADSAPSPTPNCSARSSRFTARVALPTARRASTRSLLRKACAAHANAWSTACVWREWRGVIAAGSTPPDAIQRVRALLTW